MENVYAELMLMVQNVISVKVVFMAIHNVIKVIRFFNILTDHIHIRNCSTTCLRM